MVMIPAETLDSIIQELRDRLAAKDAEIERLKEEIAHRDLAQTDVPALEEEIERLTAERDDFAQQLALRRPSVVQQDLQIVMARNNALLEDNERLRAALTTICNARRDVTKGDASETSGEFAFRMQSIACVELKNAKAKNTREDWCGAQFFERKEWPND